MTALNNLLFRVSLLDNMSGPARNMMSTMDRVTSNIQGGFNKIGYGAAGLAGAAYSLDHILQPAKEMQSALGEISSMNVGKDVLDKLNISALKFSVQYGESAAEFVRSAYDIQGAISGLSGNELPAFTNASAVLAKGTKADMGTITNYVGTMYGIFQKNADAMGKANWINMMAGQTAVAVNIFKTTGQGMSEAFTTLGAGAQTMGVGMAEQMAVMGTLQATMSGSEAGTKYRAFLDGVGNAQDKLGLKFTDSQGKMLPMVNILEKIKGKYGDIDTVAKSDLLKKAFGTQEATALVKLLSTNIDGLSGSINEVGKQTGLQGAIDMANAMVQPWEQAKSAGDALMIMLGQKMLPVLKPVFNGIVSVSEKLMRWMDLFPNITTYIGYAVFGIIGITAALAALAVVAGIGTIVSTGFGLAWSAIGLILTPLAPLITALRMAWVVMKMEMLAGSGVFTVLKTGLVAFGTQLWTNIAAIWAWNVALFANPITWIVLGIAALIGIVAAAVIYWDTWTQAVSDWFSAFDAFYLIGQGIGLIILQFKLIGQAIGWVVAGFQAIPDWWIGFKVWVSTLDPFALIGDGIGLMIAGFDAIKNWWSEFKNWLSALNPFAGISSAADSVMSGIQSVTGFKIPGSSATQPPVLDKLSTPSTVTGATAAPSLSAMAAQPKWMQQPAPGLLTDGFAPPQPIAAPAALTQSGSANVPRGGLMSQINNADNSKVVNVGGITIHNPSKPVGPLLADELQMAAG
jgi:TP901 family phage tail tape measure protein